MGLKGDKMAVIDGREKIQYIGSYHQKNALRKIITLLFIEAIYLLYAAFAFIPKR